MKDNLFREDKEKDDKKPAAKPEFGFTDIVAFSIAVFQLILPATAVFFGFFLLLYLLLKYWAK
ncbi:MAG: hypothetical protein ACOX8W_04680 [bacterium]